MSENDISVKTNDESTAAPAERSAGSAEPAKRRGPAKRSPVKRTPAGRGGAAGSAKSGAPGSDAAVSLASALSSLVAGIEKEVKAISRLSGEIDRHVSALNGLRADATARLLHLDELRAAAADGNLSAFLDTSIQPTLPVLVEEWPERLYGG